MVLLFFLKHAALTDLDASTSFFGVYDGHGGKVVAKFCATYLHQQVLKHEAYLTGDIEVSALFARCGRACGTLCGSRSSSIAGLRTLVRGNRMKISLEVARAISYLHTGCRDFVCLGNLKCENVVLEDNLEAKVTEFGLWTILSEFSEVGRLADTDVRDFGNLLLVLISGYQNSEVCEWAYAKWVEGHAETIS
ncbi:G-type lectin S-receptor-like serine threonine-kinase SD3-1 [Olea europaea subsp. europaea]|uniref:G-type lectin S-receptor-like serine threonine-kinase SD3-1 n=1 Tax=Olea europaea subsp. europaea TaxID=158383 RepID=A0A8S0T5R5_OLEEU|nr:G-type lectin S-receptor-like serine threonine-kinase SD3-1 [Olea europaea subsp. europaea]